MNKVPSKNYGFSLLEILISLVIMSVGMMGLAGLKMVSIKGTNEAHFRHEASLLMADLADRMRLNLVAVGKGEYKADTAVVASTATSISARLCHTTSCTSAQLALYDKVTIANLLKQSIPQASLTITCADNASCESVDGKNTAHTIKVSWKVKKDKSEDLTLDNINNDHEYNIRNIELTLTP